MELSQRIIKDFDHKENYWACLHIYTLEEFEYKLKCTPSKSYFEWRDLSSRGTEDKYDGLACLLGLCELGLIPGECQGPAVWCCRHHEVRQVDATTPVHGVQLILPAHNPKANNKLLN